MAFRENPWPDFRNYRIHGPFGIPSQIEIGDNQHSAQTGIRLLARNPSLRPVFLRWRWPEIRRAVFKTALSATHSVVLFGTQGEILLQGERGMLTHHQAQKIEYLWKTLTDFLTKERIKILSSDSGISYTQDDTVVADADQSGKLTYRENWSDKHYLQSIMTNHASLLPLVMEAAQIYKHSLRT